MTGLVVIGVDPGLKGGIAVLNDNQLVLIDDMPVVDKQTNAALLADFARRWPGALVAVEVQQAMPAQGRSSTLKTGKGWGTILGVFTALGHRVVDVRSQEWKPSFRLKGKDKEASRAYAIRLWPERSEAFARKRDEGRAEAALIALHVSRIERGLSD